MANYNLKFKVDLMVILWTIQPSELHTVVHFKTAPTFTNTSGTMKKKELVFSPSRFIKNKLDISSYYVLPCQF